MMFDSARPKELQLFRNTRHAIMTLYKTGGIRSFYKVYVVASSGFYPKYYLSQGVIINAIRSLGGALVLVFYDEFLHYTNWKQRLKK